MVQPRKKIVPRVKVERAVSPTIRYFTDAVESGDVLVVVNCDPDTCFERQSYLYFMKDYDNASVQKVLWGMYDYAEKPYTLGSKVQVNQTGVKFAYSISTEVALELEGKLKFGQTRNHVRCGGINA